MAVAAPTLRPAQGFGTAKAQRWILGAAMIVAMTYTLRRVVEPSLGTAPSSGSKAARLAGTGTPPAPLGQWAVAYGSGFMLLALVALPAPELAASLSLLVVVGSVLSHGNALANDIKALESGDADLSTAYPDPHDHTVSQAAAVGAKNIAAGKSPLAGVPGYGTSGVINGVGTP